MASSGQQRTRAAESRLANLSERLRAVNESFGAGEEEASSAAVDQLDAINEELDRTEAEVREAAEGQQEKVQQLRGDFEKYVVAREMLEARELQRLKELQDQAVSQLRSESQAQMESEQEVLHSIEQRLGSLENALAEGLTSQEERRRHQNLKDQLGVLEGRSTSSSSASQAMLDGFLNKAEDILHHVQGTVSAEMKAGKDVQDRIEMMLEDMKCNLRAQVHLERVAREKSEENLLQAIETACAAAERQSA